MYTKPYLLSLLSALAGPAAAMAMDDTAGSEYRSWCAHSADAEKVSGLARENHIRNCVRSLLEADREPLQTGKSKGDGDEGDS